MATDSSRHPSTPSEGNGRAERLARLYAEYVDRMNAGEAIDPQRLLAEHPDIAPMLLEQLRAFEAIDFGGGGIGPELGTLGDYTLRRQIGRGGMGIVYDAWQGSLDRQVALKVLPAGVAADHRAFMRFLREAKTAAQLSHQNIVGVYGMGVESNTPYYSMEYVEGETLAEILAGRRRQDADAEIDTPFGRESEGIVYYGRIAAAFAGVADGLQYAHSKGVVHRDIKPSNLILDTEADQDESVKLRILDFGLARLEGEESLTLSGDFVGTPVYMSPEQARRRKIAIDHRTDVYSLGAAMYETLTGRPPFRGKDHADTLTQIIEREPLEPRRLQPRTPNDLETIVLKCLRKDAADRYGTAEALAQDLRRFVRGDPIEARPRSRWEKLARRAWRHRYQLGTCVGLLFLVFAVVTLQVERRRIERKEKEQSYSPRVLDAVYGMQLARVTTRVESELPIDRRLSPLPWYLLEGVQRPGSASGPDPLEAAVEKLGVLVKEFPEKLDARYHLARALYLGGREEDALRELRAARGLVRGFVPALCLEAAILRKEDRDDQRAQVFGELGRMRTSDDWRAAFVEAHLAIAESRWRDASTHYERLMRSAGKENEPYIGFELEARIGHGLAHLLAGKLDLAIEDFLVAQDRWPEALEPVLLLGEAYYRKEEKESAERHFRRFYERSSLPDRVALAVAAIYFYLEDFHRGLEWATDRVRNLGLKERTRMPFLILLRRLDEAVDAGKKALGVSPKDAVVWGFLGMAHTFRRDHAAAVEALRRAVRFGPDDGHALYGLGLAMIKEGRLDEAVAYLERSLDEYEGPPTHTSLGIAWHLKGKTGRALEHMEKALKLTASTRRQESFEAHFRVHYGALLEALGRTEEALLQYGEAVAVSSDVQKSTKSRAVRRIDEILEREDASRLRGALEALARRLEATIAWAEDASAPVLAAFALAAIHLGDETFEPARAVDSARRAVAKSGGRDPEYLAFLARVQAAGRDFPGAAFSLKAALSLPDADPRLELTLARVKRAQLSDLASDRFVASLVEDRQKETLVGAHAAWRFFRGRTEPPTEWNEVDYDDGDWEKGEGSFGYGLQHRYDTWLNDMPGSYTTVYLRHVFEVRDPDDYEELSLYVHARDGFVAYVNGRELVRSRAGTAEPVPHDATARTAWKGPSQRIRIPADRLLRRKNCLALLAFPERVHQDRFLVEVLLVADR